MWNYEKRLQYPVKITQTNPKIAQVIITQFGGPDGELAASMRYLSQRYTMPYKEVTGILTDIGTEELAHMEMICAIVYQLTRNLTPEEIDAAYEKNTGLVIIETFEQRQINPAYTPAVLCANHGPFTWGRDAAEAVHNAVVLEEVARMARNTEAIRPDVKPAPDCIKEKHFYRKHGENAYYGQN